MAWQDGGVTIVANLYTTCRTHHRAKHMHGFSYEPAIGGIVWTTPGHRRYLTPNNHHPAYIRTNHPHTGHRRVSTSPDTPTPADHHPISDNEVVVGAGVVVVDIAVVSGAVVVGWAVPLGAGVVLPAADEGASVPVSVGVPVGVGVPGGVVVGAGVGVGDGVVVLVAGGVSGVVGAGVGVGSSRPGSTP